MLWTAFSLGLFSSLHCLGMCGPLALMVPKQDTRWWIGRMLHQVGRLMAYALLGAAFGLLGQGAALVGIQQGLSIGMGLLLLIGLLLSANWEQKLIRLPMLENLFQRLYRRMQRLLDNQRWTAPRMFNLGILNGFLPCGFVYLAIAGSMAQTVYWEQH